MTQERFYTIIKGENFVCNFDLGRSKAKVLVYKVYDNYYFVLESFGNPVAVLDTTQNVLLNAATRRSARHMVKFHEFIKEYLTDDNIKEIKL